MKFLALCFATFFIVSCGAQYKIETPYGTYEDVVDGKIQGKATINVARIGK